MSPALPAITGKQASRAAERAGFRLDRQKGSHRVYLRDSDKRRVVIPDHVGKILKPKTLSGIIQDMGMTVDEFITLP